VRIYNGGSGVSNSFIEGLSRDVAVLPSISFLFLKKSLSVSDRENE
jgi:hypothetical protein